MAELIIKYQTPNLLIGGRDIFIRGQTLILIKQQRTTLF